MSEGETIAPERHLVPLVPMYLEPAGPPPVHCTDFAT